MKSYGNTQYNNGLLKLPGSINTKPNKKIFPDLIFFIVLVAVPSSFFALVDQSIFYKAGAFDLKLLFILLSMTYLFIYIGNIKQIYVLPAGKALIILCLYILFIIIVSRVRGIPGTEIIKVVRINYIYPIVCLSLLLYTLKLDISRLFRLVRWIALATFIQGILYVISNLLGIEIFSAKAKDPLEFQGTILYQNVFAIPHFNAVIFCIAYLSSMMRGRLIYNAMWVIAISIIILSFVRNQIAVYMMYFIFLTSAVTIYISYIKIGRAFSLGLIAAFLGVIITLSFPAHTQKLLQKVTGGKVTADIQSVDTGTFDLRINAIENSFDSINSNGKLLIGYGYVREVRQGEYSLVLGGDTLVAPVFLTEGILGFTLRLIPILILLLINIKSLYKKRERKYHLYNILSISLIIPELVNIIQTTLFTHYHQTMFILLLLEIIKRKSKISENNAKSHKDNYSTLQKT